MSDRLKSPSRFTCGFVAGVLVAAPGLFGCGDPGSDPHSHPKALALSFGAPVQLASSPPPDQLAAGDLNGDGRPDLVVTGSTNAANTGAVTVLTGKGDGTFTAGSPMSQSPSSRGSSTATSTSPPAGRRASTSPTPTRPSSSPAPSTTRA